MVAAEEPVDDEPVVDEDDEPVDDEPDEAEEPVADDDEAEEPVADDDEAEEPVDDDAAGPTVTRAAWVCWSATMARTLPAARSAASCESGLVAGTFRTVVVPW